MTTMGKASKLKKIRKLAAQLPAINTYGVSADGEIITGADLLNENVKEVRGNKVELTDKFVRRKKIEVQINHNRRMKQMYNKYGLRGVAGYANAVVNFVKQKPKENGHNMPG